MLSDSLCCLMRDSLSLSRLTPAEIQLALTALVAKAVKVARPVSTRATWLY
jgi:uncharacterized membrane protein YhfC